MSNPNNPLAALSFSDQVVFVCSTYKAFLKQILMDAEIDKVLAIRHSDLALRHCLKHSLVLGVVDIKRKVFDVYGVQYGFHLHVYHHNILDSFTYLTNRN